MSLNKKYKLGIVGLGYVGLPLAVEFGKKFYTIGYDLDSTRIKQLNQGIDSTGEISKRKLQSSLKLSLTSKLEKLSKCNIYILCVPTPIDKKNNPDLRILFNATSSIGTILKKNDIVIYESTVYPGCTEEECAPILEEQSGLKYNKDFFCGYSPERINPGDKRRTITKIIKITSGSTPEIAKKIDMLYSNIINVGTYPVSSIKIAEAAKIIENCQRDINISFVNELSIIFHKMNLDTQEVLDAAGSKWNFLSFKPGLVGGHCIGVDPYYLTFKAKELGYKSKIINSGRLLNDTFSNFICENIENYFNNRKKKLKILILGITFKENCPDIRNSKVFDIYKYLHKKKNIIDVYDPYAPKDELQKKYNIDLLDYNQLKEKYYDCILIAVAHEQFINLNLKSYSSSDKTLVYDLKGLFKNQNYMRL